MPGVLDVRTASRSVRIEPQTEPILFGRNIDAVHIGFGTEDRNVSRAQGSLTYVGGSWLLRNLGQLPLRLATGVELAAGGEPYPLPTGQTVVFVRTSQARVHALELYVSG